MDADVSAPAREAMSSEKMEMRPYARLLTMLGEQLLKNERVALVELIKNSYDADADSVEISFEEFDTGMRASENSTIEIRDDGCGMSLETIRTSWMNPATPQKFLNKKHGERRTRDKGRVIQGEKGIGRFAILKLARKITLTTRTKRARYETVVLFDFTRFDDDFVEENGEEREIFLDEVEITCTKRKPETFKSNTHGTLLNLESLKGTWNDRIIDSIYRDVAVLTDPISNLTHKQVKDKFQILMYCNGEQYILAGDQAESLKSLIEDKSVFKITGQFINKSFLYQLGTNEKREKIGLYDTRMQGLWIWRQRYRHKADREEAARSQSYRCGDFKFHFFIFDFDRNAEGRYNLTQVEKNLLKQHRIYLYRDGLRVYPYGDAEDDWLNIDITRGTGRVGDFFSNDQIIGWIDITQQKNPKLRDKTNREGLIESGGAAEDFTFLIRTFLSYVKHHPFSHYRFKQERKNSVNKIHEGAVSKELAKLKETLEAAGEKKNARQVTKIESDYRRETQFLTKRAEVTEDLAGVGLSVEMTSHDIMLLMDRARDIGLQLAREARKHSIRKIEEQTDMLVGVLEQVVSGMQDIQSLFKSSRRRRRKLRVETVLDKIYQIYSILLEKTEIKYEKILTAKSPLMVSTTDGLLMQVLINLFDNAVYWLETNSLSDSREIRVTLDSERSELVFEDSGPGVYPDDRPYIFEAFFSGKGEEGRGLGLYIARQLLERHRYRIELDECRGDLGGAKFRVRFDQGED